MTRTMMRSTFRSWRSLPWWYWRQHANRHDRLSGAGVAPSLAFSANTMREDTLVGAVLATLSVNNLPQGVTVSSYAITADADNKFSLVDNTLTLEAALDYEAATSHSVTVEATLSDLSTVSGTMPFDVLDVAAFALPDLTLSASTITEGAAEGTAVGTITNRSTNSVLSMTDTALNKFALDGTTVKAGAVATDYETATTHNITIRETHTEATNSPHDTVIAITVANVFEAASLNALTLDTPTIEEGTAQGVLVGTLQDVTVGSTLSLIDNAGNRFQLDGQTIEAGSVATDYDTGVQHTITMRETLADSENSPRDSNITIVVTEAEYDAVAQFFGGAEVGFYFDASLLSTLWEDAAGTTPASVDGVVGKWDDRSGGGYHATQATTAQKPILRQSGSLYRLEWDGVDDDMATAAIDFSATDTVTLFLGEHKAADGANETVIELSANIDSNNGTWALNQSGSTVSWQSKGTTKQGSAVTRSGPINLVVTGVADISAPQVQVRTNASAGPNTTLTQGTGNYGNAYPVYIGGRAGTSRWFDGDTYQILVTNRLPVGTEIADMEAHVAAKMGMTWP